MSSAYDQQSQPQPDSPQEGVSLLPSDHGPHSRPGQRYCARYCALWSAAARSSATPLWLRVAHLLPLRTTAAWESGVAEDLAAALHIRGAGASATRSTAPSRRQQRASLSLRTSVRITGNQASAVMVRRTGRQSTLRTTGNAEGRMKNEERPGKATLMRHQSHPKACC